MGVGGCVCVCGCVGVCGCGWVCVGVCVWVGVCGGVFVCAVIEENELFDFVLVEKFQIIFRTNSLFHKIMLID